MKYTLLGELERMAKRCRELNSQFRTVLDFVKAAAEIQFKKYAAE